ncbi:hypothetical protein A4D02_34365 [Niastella koreensis]|uniref:Prokaryotic RING finger family 4 n=2 Tax=Niastella koreensis TaxID=354356 RepID=G8TRL7_NIAKG|nr:hypothetical protein [Niastella koreensis]AEW02164.1 hypothetical protein Niako_5934 [Niastella koreensis GR20-10]OQP45113.1 hypothetical protein A4D02_34365 [Niastella koreensis]
MNPLLTVSIRQKAIYIPEGAIINNYESITRNTGLLVANLTSLGYGVSESLLKTLNNTAPGFQLTLLEMLRDVTGVNKNWTPLTKDWLVPTGESFADHLATWFANIYKIKGTVLPCGHNIPDGTFPLHRYNGCPFCGKPFEFGDIENFKQGSKQKILELWSSKDAADFLTDLLSSKTALDATQMDSLKILLAELPLPAVSVGMKETLMAVIDIYITRNEAEKAQALFTSPADVLRYLWYKHTGFLQIIEPATLIKRKAANNSHRVGILDKSASAKFKEKSQLKLKYTRKESLMVATWLNNMNLDTAGMCEMMHPKRGMWVRFIRALRLAEYSKRKGYDKLRDLLDKFYKEDYQVWQGMVEHYKLRYDVTSTFALLQQRPGLFARSLFANMLWFGSDITIAAFMDVIDKVPARLLFTLAMYADNYFDITNTRVVKPLGGVNKNIQPNRMLALYNNDQLQEMKEAVADLCLLAVKTRFARIAPTGKSMYIAPSLFKIPVSIGDRNETVQDLSGVLMGTRFTVEGDAVRLFMQWGTGLTAQHMDMDLSCLIAYKDRTERCSYSELTVTGCQHSGDVRYIPNKIGTAEYIEMNIPVLQKAGALYVSFTCNAYSNGGITPNLVVGWMNSKHKMTVSQKSGVAYDPSCVQHQVRVVNDTSKGLVFGVLDVAKSEIIWLELQFEGQVVQNLDTRTVENMLQKLNSKLTIGQLLKIKAEAQLLQLVEEPGQADEVYTTAWAQNTAAVTKLLID